MDVLTVAPTAETLETVSASGSFTLLWLIVAVPLASAAVLMLGGRRLDPVGPIVGTGAAIASFVLGAVVFVAILGQPEEERSVVQTLWTWVSVGGFEVDMAFLLDPLSMCFVLLITGVGSLIHVYSIGYMEHDPDKRRFFAYLNLFLAAMLLLVLGDSYFSLYVGWEGVGLASYLLIGFWNHKPEYATAAKKAFVMNRVGDVGLAVAIFLMFSTFGTVTLRGVAEGAPEATETVLTVMGLLLLLAACGKSAQVPLQAWLGDAMAGPTPVSALIHAATMVTAGVYLIVRSSAIFNLAPGAQLAVVIVGAVTLLFGAVIGCAKDDIKKVLAGSTMSQIGYMVLAAGLGPVGYVFAIAHLIAHGFFKAGLFLGAGSVMHGMNDDVDMRKFGGLRTFMPITFVTFGAGYLAIIGVPPFSGFFTKDKIIEAAFSESFWLGAVALLGAGITAFYMTRLLIMTFFGQPRWGDERHPHESPKDMTIPMMVLAVGSVGAGAFLILGNRLERFLEPVTGFEEPEIGISIRALEGISLATVLVGVFIAYWMYARQPVPAVAPVGSPVTVAARRDLYQDAFNEAVVMRPGQWLTRLLVWADNRLVDGAVGGFAALMGGISSRSRRLQTGFVRSYALSMFGGAVLVVAAVLAVRL